MLAALGTVGPARAQGSAAKTGPDPATVRDPELERDSKKNFEAAKLYFNLRKAYRASLARCEEIIAGNPNYSRIDEVLWFAGMSNLYLAQKKGKQEPTLTTEQHFEQARKYLSQLVSDYPDSKFREKAEEELRKLGDVKTEVTKQ
jgi:outer membrane protein assembly factor BamD (BamD/ComL family)